MGGPVSQIPAFAKDFPEDPRLDALVALFEQGNYQKVRREAAALLKATDDKAIHAAVAEILKRLQPDPLALYLLAISAALLAILAGWYWTQTSPSPAGREQAPFPPPSAGPSIQPSR